MLFIFSKLGIHLLEMLYATFQLQSRYYSCLKVRSRSESSGLTSSLNCGNPRVHGSVEQGAEKSKKEVNIGLSCLHAVKTTALNKMLELLCVCWVFNLVNMCQKVCNILILRRDGSLCQKLYLQVVLLSPQGQKRKKKNLILLVYQHKTFWPVCHHSYQCL